MKPTQLGPLERANLSHWTSKLIGKYGIKPTQLGLLEGAILNDWTSKLKG
jgi:hypothetical protein